MYVGVSRNLWSEELHMWTCDWSSGCLCTFLVSVCMYSKRDREREKCVWECEGVVCLHVHILIKIFKSLGWYLSPCASTNGYKWCNTSSCINNWACSCKPAGQMASITQYLWCSSHSHKFTKSLAQNFLSPFLKSPCRSTSMKHMYIKHTDQSTTHKETLKWGQSQMLSSV